MRNWTHLRGLAGVVLATLSLSVSFAQNKSQMDLLAIKDHRPSAIELITTPDALEPIANQKADQSHINAIANGLPRLLAAIEKIYPGAQIGFLGRDTALLADATQALLLQYGQVDRVRYINLSTPIFSSLTPEQLAQYLISLGAPGGKDGKRPFVLVDFTSLAKHSQSTQLMSAYIKHLADQGLTPEEIVERFNVLTLADINNGMNPLTQTAENIAVSKQYQANEIRQHSRYRYIFSLGKNERGMAYSSEWHDRFDRFRIEGNGEITPFPSEMKSDRDRVAALVEQIEIINAVSDPNYQTTVAEVFKQAGAPLPVQTSDLNDPSASLGKIQTDLRKLMKKVKKQAAKRGRAQKREEYLTQKKIQETIADMLKNSKILAEGEKPASSRRQLSSGSFDVGNVAYTLLRLFQDAQPSYFHQNWKENSPLNAMMLAALFKMHDNRQISSEDLAIVFNEMIRGMTSKGGMLGPDAYRIISKNEKQVLAFWSEGLQRQTALNDVQRFVAERIAPLVDLKKYAPRLKARIDLEIDRQKKRTQQAAKVALDKAKQFKRQEMQNKYAEQRTAQEELRLLTVNLPVLTEADKMDRQAGEGTLWGAILTKNARELGKIYLKHENNLVRWPSFPAKLPNMTLSTMMQLFEAGKIDEQDLAEIFKTFFLPLNQQNPLNQDIKQILSAHPRSSLKMAIAIISQTNGVTNSLSFFNIQKNLLDRFGVLSVLPPEAGPRLKLEEERVRKQQDQVLRADREKSKQKQRDLEREKYLAQRKMQTEFADLVKQAPIYEREEDIKRNDPNIVKNYMGEFSGPAHALMPLYFRNGGDHNFRSAPPSPLHEVMTASLFQLYEQTQIDTADLRQLFKVLVLPAIQNYPISPDLLKMFDAHSATVEKAIWSWVDNGATSLASMQAIDQQLREIENKAWKFPATLKERIEEKRRQIVRAEQQRLSAEKLKNQKKALEFEKARYVEQRRMQDRFAELTDQLPKVDASADQTAGVWYAPFGGRLQLTPNGRRFADTYMEAYAFMPGLSVAVSRTSPFTEMALSSLLSLYENEQLAGSEFQKLFELILAYPAAIDKIPPGVIKILEAHLDSKGVRLVFGPENRGIYFPQQTFLTERPYNGYTATKSRTTMGNFYNSFIRSHHFGVSCQRIFR